MKTMHNYIYAQSQDSEFADQDFYEQSAYPGTRLSANAGGEIDLPSQDDEYMQLDHPLIGYYGC